MFAHHLNVPTLVIVLALWPLAGCRPHQCEKGNVKECEQQCEKGHAGSCFELGGMRAESRTLHPDYDMAKAAYRRACNGGHARACVELGNLSSDHTSKTDYRTAVAAYVRACDAGNLDGCNGLAGLYVNGLGVPEDFSEAFRLFKLTCDSGSVEGCGSLAVAYEFGRGVPRDAAKATVLYRQTCKVRGEDPCLLADALEGKPVTFRRQPDEKCTGVAEGSLCSDTGKCRNGFCVGPCRTVTGPFVLTTYVRQPMDCDCEEDPACGSMYDGRVADLSDDGMRATLEFRRVDGKEIPVGTRYWVGDTRGNPVCSKLDSYDLPVSGIVEKATRTVSVPDFPLWTDRTEYEDPMTHGEVNTKFLVLITDDPERPNRRRWFLALPIRVYKWCG
jgi:Sel1 repeat